MDSFGLNWDDYMENLYANRNYFLGRASASLRCESMNRLMKGYMHRNLAT